MEPDRLSALLRAGPLEEATEFIPANGPALSFEDTGDDRLGWHGGGDPDDAADAGLRLGCPPFEGRLVVFYRDADVAGYHDDCAAHEKGDEADIHFAHL
jgi:hypothetical protein